MFLAGAVLMLWLVGISQQVPVMTASVTLGSVPYQPPALTAQPLRQARCREWYFVVQGDTQWTIALLYSGNIEKHLWLRQMRYMSGLPVTDENIRANQRLCVGW